MRISEFVMMILVRLFRITPDGLHLRDGIHLTRSKTKKTKMKTPQRHLAVDEPIINTPFENPSQYWVYDSATGLPVKAPGRRPAHYYFRSRRRADAAQTSMFAEEEMVELGEVNKIRDKPGNTDNFFTGAANS